jgi:hypothetical protein
MPNRMFYDGILDSEPFNALSLPAQLFYLRSIPAADDAGRLDGRTTVLRSKLWPLGTAFRNSAIAKFRAECQGRKLLYQYEWDGKQYVQITKWRQTGNSKRSEFPDWRGRFAIEYVEFATGDRDRDGDAKKFVSTSIEAFAILNGTATPDAPSAPDSDGVEMGSPTKTKTETKTSSSSSRERTPDRAGIGNDDDSLRSILRWAGVRGKNLALCCQVPGLKTAAVLVAALRAKRIGKSNPVGLLTQELLNGYAPPKVIAPRELLDVWRVGALRAVCGHRLSSDPGNRLLNHGDRQVTFVAEDGSAQCVAASRLTPENVEIQNPSERYA